MPPPPSTITLSYIRPYRSITSFSPAVLPSLTILTGANGSGKSHLLEAIAKGDIAADCAPDAATDVELYDQTRLVPNDVGVSTFASIHEQRDWFLNHVQAAKKEHSPNLIATLQKLGLYDRFANDPWRILKVDTDELGILPEEAEKVRQAVTSYNNRIADFIRSRASNDKIRKSILDDLVAGGTQFSRLSDRDIEDRSHLFYGGNLFQHAFGQLFFAYFDRARANRMRRMDSAEGRVPSIPPLTEEEFVEAHGSPPWDFVNKVITRANLDFEIDHPIDYEATQYLPQLTKKSTNTVVNFGALSSGERILMSFAFCLYHTTDKRQGASRPKLLLFDEVDAPLHPSMSKTLVGIVKEVIVEQEGIPVIMVTHSPSTVAVAPEGSVHLLAGDTHLITKEHKRRAVATLTSEIPTMSIDFSGRRQVFVESNLDADRYTRLYQRIGAFMKTERSLAFIGVGRRSTKGEKDAGSARVIATANRLADEGATSIFGLVDWDTKNSSSDRVVVLAEGVRYSVENCLLDPLLVAAVLLGEDGDLTQTLTLPTTATFASFSKLAPTDLQRAVDQVSNRVMGQLAAPTLPPTRVSYLGGFELDVPTAYLQHPGHQLEDAVRATFSVLRRFHQPNLLMLHIIDSVIRNHPNLCPREPLAAMQQLCALEA